ncbi:MAG: UPF0146 family protein [Candidatus Odinarchaeota archaeon]
MPLPDQDEIIKFIVDNFKSPRKIVEVGIGFYPDIALKLKNLYPETEILVIDLSERVEKFINKTGGLKISVDDVTNPNIEYYYNTDLIYSIRPPIELIPDLLNISKKVNCSLIIRCLSGEFPSDIVLKYFKIYNTTRAMLLAYNI